MDLLPFVQQREKVFADTVTEWFLASDAEKTVAFASESRLLLAYFYASIKRRSLLCSLSDCGADILEVAKGRKIGLLICTERLVDMSGDRLLAEMSRRDPDTRCLLVIDEVTHKAQPHHVYRAPVVVSSVDFGEMEMPLRQGLLAAIGKSTYRSPSVMPLPDNELSPLADALTDRERQLLECYARGLNLREASESMSCTYQSAKTYSRNLLQKLGVGSRALAIRRAIQLGVVRMDRR